MYDGKKISIEFPCDFPIKIMGKANEEFERRALTIIRKHSPDISENAIRIRHSKEGNYMSITATIFAQSQQQLDDIYQELTADKSVLIVL